MPPVAPPAARELPEARSSRHDVSHAWLVGVLGLVVVTPAAALAAVAMPSALDTALIRQLAQPQGASSSGAGVVTPQQTPPVRATADAASATPAVGSTPARASGAVEPIGVTGMAGTPKASSAPAAKAGAPESRPAQIAATPKAPASSGQPLRSSMDVALIRRLAQPQTTASSAPAVAPAKADVPRSAETMGVTDTTGAPPVPGATAVMADAHTVKPAPPTENVAAPAPSGASTAQPADRLAVQPFPLDKRVIAALASGETASVREEGEQATNDESATPTLPQTQLDMIKGVFAPEMQD